MHSSFEAPLVYSPAPSVVSSVAVAGIKLPVANEMKVLAIVLVWHLSFGKPVMMAAQSCHYHAQAVRHMPLTDNGAGINTGAQPDTDQARLLQFTASRLTYQLYPDTTSRAEQHCQDCSASTKAVQCTPAAAPLAASSSQSELQAGCDDLQDEFAQLAVQCSAPSARNSIPPLGTTF